VYLRRLLARHPEWVWTQRASAPMQDGFLNFWQAKEPIAGTEVGFSGVCLVVLRDGLIARNEVFFDRTLFLEAMRQAGR